MKLEASVKIVYLTKSEFNFAYFFEFHDVTVDIWI